MNTREVATALGTDPKTLRNFLRHPSSTFVPVGSGGRYEFSDEDIPTLKRRFTKWAESQTIKTPRAPKVTRERPRTTTRADRDREVWEAEGTITLPDIRRPSVRAEVHAEAARRAERLDEMLLKAGLHISQWRDRV